MSRSLSETNDIYNAADHGWSEVHVGCAFVTQKWVRWKEVFCIKNSRTDYAKPLVQVMACCLVAPGYYLKQSWFWTSQGNSFSKRCRLSILMPLVKFSNWSISGMIIFGPINTWNYNYRIRNCYTLSTYFNSQKFQTWSLLALRI